jgi:uncharacterized phage protein gp47/JayE
VSGLEATGWVSKSAADFAADIEAELRASSAFGPDVDTSGESLLGQLIGVFATRMAEVHEAAGVVYNSRDPRGASFAGLDAVASLTGTTRRAATKGTVTLAVNLNAGVTLPVGSIAHVDGQPSNRWVTTAAATNSGGGAADVAVAAEAETAGAFTANASTITSIATPRTGWNSVTNSADAAPGSAAESDVALRARRERELTAGGTSPLDSIRAALAAVSGVSSVSVDENTSDAYDFARDLPGHSVRAVVQGGTDAAVARALWAARAAGIETQGSTSVIITDAGGFPRSVKLTRPTNVNAYATVRVVYDAATYPGDDTLKAALANITTGQLAGAPIRTSTLITAALAVAGVTDCTAALLGRSSGAVYAANLTAAPAEVLKLAAGRITIVRVFG